jgi:beta-lactamase class A
MITRRHIIGLALAAAWAAPAAAARADRELKAILKRIGGRLGVHALDSQSGKRFGIDDRSRYAMASTFKLPLAAAILWQVDRGAFGLERTLPVARENLLPNSPAVEAALAAGGSTMTLRELCNAIITVSDNAAANILLTGIGGPPALTTFMRNVGDDVTRMDRMETAVNSNMPGDPRDTTTPRAMVDSMLRIFTQDVLSIPSRALLIEWLTGSKTGLARIHAGIPKTWMVGGKTGTGENGAVNDLVVAFPPDRRPVFVAVYMSGSQHPLGELNAAHAQIGALVSGELGRD